MFDHQKKSQWLFMEVEDAQYCNFKIVLTAEGIYSQTWGSIHLPHFPPCFLNGTVHIRNSE